MSYWIGREVLISLSKGAEFHGSSPQAQENHGNPRSSFDLFCCCFVCMHFVCLVCWFFKTGLICVIVQALLELNL